MDEDPQIEANQMDAAVIHAVDYVFSNITPDQNEDRVGSWLALFRINIARAIANPAFLNIKNDTQGRIVLQCIMRLFFQDRLINTELSLGNLPINENSLHGLVAKQAMQSGKTYTISLDRLQDPDYIRECGLRCSPKLRENIARYPQDRSAIVTAMFRDKKFIGTLQIIDKSPHANGFNIRAVQFIENISGKMAEFIFRNLHDVPGKWWHLLLDNVLSRESLLALIAKTTANKESLIVAIHEQYHTPLAKLGRSAADFYGCIYVPLRSQVRFPYLIKEFSANFLARNSIVPILTDDDQIWIVVPDMEHREESINHIAAALKLGTTQFTVAIALDIDIQAMIRKIDKADAVDSAMDAMLDQDDRDKLSAATVVDSQDRADQDDENIAKTQHVRLFVTSLITRAKHVNASDIHIEPDSKNNRMNVRFRIDGLLYNIKDFDFAVARRIVSVIKSLAGLDIAERRLPQDGQISLVMQKGTKPTDLRVATIPSSKGEQVVIRLASNSILELAQLNLSQENEAYLRNNVFGCSKGIFIVSGPTGSGKTGSVHAILAHINQVDKKIWTAEDPVEIYHPGLCQIEINTRIGYDYPRAMKALLRADPDVIFIGETRNAEVGAIAVEAALTGHLVFTTLHANSAEESLTRLQEMGLDPHNYGSSLVGVLAQRLMRILCSCKEAYTPTAEEIAEIKKLYDMPPFAILELPDAFQLYRPKGCEKCNSLGYKGRTGIHQLGFMNDTIRTAIVGGAQAHTLALLFQEAGSRNLFQDGIQKIVNGISTMKELMRVAS